MTPTKRPFHPALLGALLALAATPSLAADAAAGTDAAALATLLAVNDHEIQAARLALDRKVSQPVAEYARMMESEHSDNQSKTRALAESQAITPAESADVRALKAKASATRERLGALQGAGFEAAYIDAMVKDHGEVLGKLDGTLIPGARDTAVAQHLRSTREHVAKHLERARALDNDTGH